MVSRDMVQSKSYGRTPWMKDRRVAIIADTCTGTGPAFVQASFTSLS